MFLSDLAISWQLLGVFGENLAIIGNYGDNKYEFKSSMKKLVLGYAT